MNMTREQALQAIKAKMDYYESDKRLRAAIETLIPELAESEDERIRIALIKLMTVAGESYVMSATGFEKDRLIAYLEKQKEQKPEVDESTKRLNENWMKQHFDDYKEQKPADLSEMLIHKEPYIAPVPTPMVADEQKPAEWSEEDEDMINMLVSYVEDPSCWNLKCPREKLVAFIKSLKPHWKPSEEQIYSLGTVVKGYNECTVGSVGYHLKEMYEQLKKLM